MDELLGLCMRPSRYAQLQLLKFATKDAGGFHFVTLPTLAMVERLAKRGCR